jgi:hypothetical protein
MEAARTSETSVDNHFTRQYNPEDSSEHHTRRRENLKSHKKMAVLCNPSLKRLKKNMRRELNSKFLVTPISGYVTSHTGIV